MDEKATHLFTTHITYLPDPSVLHTYYLHRPPIGIPLFSTEKYHRTKSDALNNQTPHPLSTKKFLANTPTPAEASAWLRIIGSRKI